jgi:outer membrane protein assembly factor BamB
MTNRRPVLSVWWTALLPLVILTAAPVQATDWAQWRGPQRDGVSKESGLLDRWPTNGPVLLWKTNGLGRGYSGVSVADGRIFTAGDDADSCQLRALDLEGKHRWATRLGKPGEPGGYAGPRSVPTVDGGFVYALGQFGDLICVEAATGVEKWRKNLKKDFGGQVGGWGYSESVLVDGSRLVCTPGGSQGTIAALDKETGTPLWRTTRFTDNAEYSSVVPATIGGVRQYVQLTQRSVVGVAPEDGKVLWRADRMGRTAVIPTPIVHEDHVYVTSGYGVGCNLFKIVKDAEGFATEQVYANKNMANHHGGVIRLGEYLYGHSDREWVCQDFKTGEIKWSHRGVGKGSIAYADGRFYLRSESGKGVIALIEASPEGYKELGRFAPPERSEKNSWPHPVIADGRLYIRDQDWLLCYNVRSK